MRVTIAIPIVSSERLSLLSKAIESIQAQTYKNICTVIVVDARPVLYEIVKNQFTSVDISIILNKKHTYWVGSVNRVWREFDSDYYVYAADDITFPPECIASAVAIMVERFPDGFGLINLFRRDKATFGLFGHKFANHFPERQVLCPDFIHYGADREITEVATELGIYVPSVGRENNVKHQLKIEDETWQEVEKIKGKDPEMRRLRKEKGYKWGIDFNLIRK